MALIPKINPRFLYSDEEWKLNLAAFVPETTALGPGLRAALWVQGCPFSCPGCIAPEWIAQKPAFQVPVNWMVDTILNSRNITGLTISGGEPMLQAKALHMVVRNLLSQRYFDIICFTGFKYEELRKNPPVPEVLDFLNVIDLLIDGPYVSALNNNKGLRGSSNQRLIHLTGRLKKYDLENQPRNIELKYSNNSLMMVGIPTTESNNAINKSYLQLQVR